MRAGFGRGQWALMLLLGVGALTPESVGAVTVTSSTSDFSGWSVENFEYGTAGASAGVVGTGGNPGAYWQQSHTIGPAGPGNASVVLAFVSDPNFSFDPAVDGPIDTIDFFIDVRRTPGFGINQAFSLAVIQDGMYYLAEIGSTAPWDVTGSQNLWGSRSYLELKQADFTRIDTPAGQSPVPTIGSLLVPNDQPDFSVRGKPIRVGLFMQNNTSAGSMVDRASDYDNIQIDLVPEPSAALSGLVGVATAFLAFVRVRAQAARPARRIPLLARRAAERPRARGRAAGREVEDAHRNSARDEGPRVPRRHGARRGADARCGRSGGVDRTRGRPR